MTDKSYETLLDTLYDAAIAPQGWVDVCDCLAETFGGIGTILIPDDSAIRSLGLPHSESVHESFEIYQRDGWYLRDERTRGFARRRRTGVMFDQDFMTYDEMARLPYYQDFLRPCGLMWFAGVEVNVDGKRWTASIQRSSKQGPFDETERKQLAIVSKHLSRAATTAAALRYARAEGAIAAFERMSIGAIAVDERAHVIIINQAALALMGDGLRIANGSLSATDPDAAAGLSALVWGSIGRARQAGELLQMLCVPRPSGKRAYQVSVCPLGPLLVASFSHARAIVLIVDPERRHKPPQEMLRAQYGLTKQEAKLAEQITEGLSLANAANVLSITEETARSYLKSIFSKTDTHKQGQLISLLARLSLPSKNPSFDNW